jgi:hypothetical protein
VRNAHRRRPGRSPASPGELRAAAGTGTLRGRATGGEAEDSASPAERTTVGPAAGLGAAARTARRRGGWCPAGSRPPGRAEPTAIIRSSATCLPADPRGRPPRRRPGHGLRRMAADPGRVRGRRSGGPRYLGHGHAGQALPRPGIVPASRPAPGGGHTRSAWTPVPHRPSPDLHTDQAINVLPRRKAEYSREVGVPGWLTAVLPVPDAAMARREHKGGGAPSCMCTAVPGAAVVTVTAWTPRLRWSRLLRRSLPVMLHRRRGCGHE